MLRDRGIGKPITLAFAKKPSASQTFVNCSKLLLCGWVSIASLMVV